LSTKGSKETKAGEADESHDVDTELPSLFLCVLGALGGSILRKPGGMRVPFVRSFAL
jgi:hypothetical protein